MDHQTNEEIQRLTRLLSNPSRVFYDGGYLIGGVVYVNTPARLLEVQVKFQIQYSGFGAEGKTCCSFVYYRGEDEMSPEDMEAFVKNEVFTKLDIWKHVVES